MKYLNSFNSVGALNNFYKGKDYEEPNVNVIKISENEDPIVDMSSEYEIICFFDTTENLSGSPDLITNYDLTSLESIIIDGNRYRIKDLPLNKSELEPGEHIIKLKYKNKTTFGNLDNSPIFMNNYLKKVIIPKGIETLQGNVFLNCQGLEYIKIPNTVKLISNIGIMSSSKIKFLDLSEINPNLLYTLIYNSGGYYIDELICPNIETVQNQMFAGKYIKKINLGESVTSIGDLAFAGNSYLEELIMPNTVTSIGNAIFNSSYNLKKINISDSLTSIPSGMFNGCNKLEEVNISNNSSLTSFNNGAFSGCTNLIKINVPNTITSIGDGAFNNCSNLREINISNNSLLTSIGQSAFNNCNNLTSINLPSSITTISNNTFYYCNNLRSITIPNSVTSIGNSAFYYCNNLTSINIPDSVTSIGEYAFYGTKLTNINISNNLTSIGSYAFNLDSNTRVNLYFDNSTINNLGSFINPSLIKNLETGQHAITQNGELCLTTFGGFSNLETITFPEGLTKLPNISNFSSLKTLNIPLTITSIDDNYFYGCNSLEDSYVEDGIRYIDIDGFGTYIINVTDFTLQHYTIKNGVKGLPFTFNSSFTNIQSITLPNSLANIVDGAFDYLYDNDILTSQQIDFILTINQKSISQISILMKKPKSYFEDKYFSICALSNGTLYYSFIDIAETNESENYKVLEYSKDNGETWLSLNNLNIRQKQIYNISKNDIILFRSVIEPSFINLSNNNTYLGEYIANGIGNMYTNFDYYVCGNIMSLLYGDNFINQTSLATKNYAFDRLFDISWNNYDPYKNKLKEADKLILPATILSSYCYEKMFKGCRSLTTAPELPATTLADHCYDSMFLGCTALTTAPELPATALINYCYKNMFNGCTSLTTAPTLPATTLSINCYDSMFNGCTSLTTVPSLSATKLTENCYSHMFKGCTALTTAPSLPATTLAESCYQYMFSDCTSLTTAPELPATTLINYCYFGMFNNCISLIESPILGALSLSNVVGCYTYMFRNCTNLNKITMLATSFSNYGTNDAEWVKNVSATGTFIKSSGVSLQTATEENNYKGIPSGWTVQDYVAS